MLQAEFTRTRFQINTVTSFRNRVKSFKVSRLLRHGRHMFCCQRSGNDYTLKLRHCVLNMAQICPGLNANEMQIPHDKHKQSVLIGKKLPKHIQFSQIWSNIKMSNNPAKYEVLIKQYLRSVLDLLVTWRSIKISVTSFRLTKRYSFFWE